MDLNSILIHNLDKINSKRPSNKRSLEYQNIVNLNQIEGNNIKFNSSNNIFVNIEEREFKKNETISSTTSNHKPKNNIKKQKKDIKPKEAKIGPIVEVLIKHFNNQNNSKVFKLIQLSEQLNLKISKFEEVIEVLSILKIIKLLHDMDSFEWVGTDNNTGFLDVLYLSQNSKYNFVTGKSEIFCEKCKLLYKNNYNNNKNHIHNQDPKDFSRYKVDDITYQILKLLLNTTNPNSTPCLPLDTICGSLYYNVNIKNKSTFNILKDSKHLKLAKVILKVLNGFKFISIKCVNNGFSIYYWEYPVTIQCLHLNV